MEFNENDDPFLSLANFLSKVFVCIPWLFYVYFTIERAQIGV